jgi:hypothetical protein
MYWEQITLSLWGATAGAVMVAIIGLTWVGWGATECIK